MNDETEKAILSYWGNEQSREKILEAYSLAVSIEREGLQEQIDELYDLIHKLEIHLGLAVESNE